MRFILLPGMGCTPILQCNWYAFLQQELINRVGIESTFVNDFPDPFQCKESIWLPHIINDIGVDNDTVLIGHSSGACAAMRYLEKAGKEEADVPKIKGAILVATAYTDLGDEQEAASEYFNKPWDCKSIRKGADKIHLFHSSDDHLIPVSEARYIVEQLNSISNDNNDLSDFEYQEMRNGHFFEPFDELLNVIDNKFLS